MSVPLPSASYGLDEKQMSEHDHEGSHKCLSEEVKDFAAIDSDNELPPQEVGDKVDIVFDKSIIKEILEVGDQNFKKPGRPDIVTVVYEAFYNKKKRKVFDSSNGEPIQIVLGDPTRLEGFWRGMEHLKVGEKARIRIKPNYAFANPKGLEQVTLLSDNPELRQKLSKKIIYYEVKLISFVKRRDITGDGLISKTYFSEGEPCTQPTDCDQLFLNIKVFQKLPENILFQQESWNLAMATDPLMTKAFSKILLSLRKSEECEVEVKPKLLQSEEEEDQFAFKGIDRNQSLFMRLLLINSITCQDFYHDKSTFKRVFVKGKGGMPYIESTVKFRLKVEIDGKVIFNNLRPQTQKQIAMLPGRQDTEIISKFKDIELEDTTPKTEKQKRADYFKKINPPQDENQEEQDQDLGMALQNQFFSTSPSSPQEYLMKRLDDYEFPAIVIKGLTSMKRGEVAEFDCNKLKKLNNNFGQELVKMQSHVSDTSKARITLEMMDYSRNLPSMYRLPLEKKKERIERIKSIATRFFKAGNIKRSCKLYQKINGYYNFGDISNNFQKEDEESKQYKSTMDALLQIKKSCFVNVVVCKWKMSQFTSVVNIAQQVSIFERQVLSDMDDKNTKCLYFLGKASAALQKYPDAIRAFKRLMQLDPNNQDVKNELALVNQKYKKDITTQSNFYSAMFKKE